MAGLLLTGATGLVGGELLARLLRARPGHRLFLLVRDPDRVPPRFRVPQVSVLAGDITAPDLGIAPHSRTPLLRTVTEIVHCAADTRLHGPAEEIRRVNAGGTRNLLRFAEACPRLTRFLHVSTAWVAGRSPGTIPEAMVSHNARFSNAHQQSKYEAELLVAEAAAYLPMAIARISTIVGERGGRVRQFHYFHELLEVLPRLVVPVFPYHEETIVDLVASDWVGEALAYLVLHGFQAGSVYHLSAGARAGMSIDEMIAETQRIFAVHPSTQALAPVRIPRPVPLPEWDEFVERTHLEGSRQMNDLLRALQLFLPHLGIPQRIENERTLAVLEAGGIALPRSREVYSQVLRWCLDRNWSKEAEE